MATMTLFNRVETIKRADGFYYENGVPKANYISVPITCNIQPYRDGDNVFRVDEGFRSIYGIMVYSKEQLIPNDELNETIGDVLTYNGNEFICIDYADFTGHALSDRTQHHLGLFYRKDKK